MLILALMQIGLTITGALLADKGLTQCSLLQQAGTILILRRLNRRRSARLGVGGEVGQGRRGAVCLRARHTLGRSPCRGLRKDRLTRQIRRGLRWRAQRRHLHLRHLLQLRLLLTRPALLGLAPSLLFRHPLRGEFDP